MIVRVNVNVVLNRTVVVDSDWRFNTINCVIQLTLTLKKTTAQVVETSVTVNNNSPIHTQPTQKIHCKLDYIYAQLQLYTTVYKR